MDVASKDGDLSCIPRPLPVHIKRDWKHRTQAFRVRGFEGCGPCEHQGRPFVPGWQPPGKGKAPYEGVEGAG